MKGNPIFVLPPVPAVVYQIPAQVVEDIGTDDGRDYDAEYAAYLDSRYDAPFPIGPSDFELAFDLPAAEDDFRPDVVDTFEDVFEEDFGV